MYVQRFVELCFVFVILSAYDESYEQLTHIGQGCFTGPEGSEPTM